MMVQLITGLMFLHIKKVTHRNIKPSNLFKDKYGYYKISDYGRAKIDDMIDEKSNTIPQDQPVDKLLYHSPELLAKESYYDWRTDIFSLGVSFYHIIALRYPFCNLDECKDIVKKIT